MTLRPENAIPARLTAPARLSGLLECPQVQSACAAHWMALQQTLGITSTDAGGGTSGAPPAGSSNCASADLSAVATLLLLGFALRHRRTPRR